ncbi:helix-turn-helix domain-containing protein [Aminiphilus circumscriptus]|uniref:helix-turn-helix domain-containing protein n=1 Tax=Aminiphilus circumscriptus TaxID=290732 RepID=UPI0004BBFF72|nr:helix-turn-helix domain-containing protein [Aminiphilus circumscriptus]
MSHHHLPRDEREIIIVIGLRIGVSPQVIASRIGRSRSAIRREIPRRRRRP